jgi:A/G-specific adenine glycosylase
LRTFKHGVTRYRITLDCYRAAYASGRVRANNGSAVRWIEAIELAELPMSTTGRLIAGQITNRSRR